MQACYHASILVAVELNRLSNNPFHFWVAFLNTACALVVASLYITGLILEPYKRWPVTVVLFNALIRFLLQKQVIMLQCLKHMYVFVPVTV